MKAATLCATLAVLAVAVSCNGTTGDQLVTFTAFARGAPGAGQAFTVGGYSIRLTTAKIHLGAVYFDESPPSTGGESPICIAPGVYAAQVAGPVDVDVLSEQPQEFAVYGNGAADTAQSWQMWLTDGDVNEANLDPMVHLQGVATRLSDGAAFSFGAIVSINSNRLPPVSDPSQPGQNPLCKQRIVQIGGLDLTFFDAGKLTITIDPRVWFNLGLDFASLPLVTDANCEEGDALIPINPQTYAYPVESSDGGSTCGASAQPCCTDDAGIPLAGAACQETLFCNEVCSPERCIPNTNFASGAGARQGVELFNGILTGGPAAYSVTYTH